jgi:hypothetical protein
MLRANKKSNIENGFTLDMPTTCVNEDDYYDDTDQDKDYDDQDSRDKDGESKNGEDHVYHLQCLSQSRFRGRKVSRRSTGHPLSRLSTKTTTPSLSRRMPIVKC